MTQKRKKKSWVYSNGTGAKEGELIEVEIEHYHKPFRLKNAFAKGHFESDGFYFSDGGELSNNWNIIRWRKIK